MTANAQARKIITDAIGFEFGHGDMQPVNDHDMTNLAAAIEAALARAQAREAVGEEASFDAWLASTGLRIEPNVRECMRSAWNVRAALSAPVAPFQSRVGPWLLDCFGADVADDIRERGDRLLEEVLELLQSHGYDPARVATLRDYVFSRPVGEPEQEVGGVMVTLAAYCRAARVDMHQAGEAELARILQPEILEKIRTKQASKRGLHTPLPVPPTLPAV